MSLEKKEQEEDDNALTFKLINPYRVASEKIKLKASKVIHLIWFLFCQKIVIYSIRVGS